MDNSIRERMRWERSLTFGRRLCFFEGGDMKRAQVIFFSEMKGESGHGEANNRKGRIGRNDVNWSHSVR
ncbi:hypothetical protein Back11_63990 [Paenibacillus baekrokdamisoli]|uniref:Uncharacterized protein n=1 Tax=Paenibacillus baekrokdamisoli TaxID=1712516 RepID=A0A3G9JQF3_9BACL|nr:hypothetical protein Back11_63810 [Paenibacillus baekrokdamisoli]BBH25054.1 hypothetical protein Back11_63990 [Paenibacillus baekrokdamisoli]